MERVSEIVSIACQTIYQYFETESKVFRLQKNLKECRIRRDYDGESLLQLELAECYEKLGKDYLSVSIYSDMYNRNKDVAIGQKALDYYIREGEWFNASNMSYKIGMQTKSEKHLEEAILWSGHTHWIKDLDVTRIENELKRSEQKEKYVK